MTLPALPLFHRLAGQPVIVLGHGEAAAAKRRLVERVGGQVIDDLATDAASKAAFVRGLRHAGASVSDCFVIFYHGVFPGSAERLASLGLAMHALATWKDMLRLSSQESLLSPLDRDVIETFLQDPAAWSAAHGGRTVA